MQFPRAAFPALCSRNVARPKLPRVGSGSSQNVRKRKATTQAGYLPVRFTPKETWTHDVYVLSRKDAEFTPNRDESEMLQTAGLGKLKIVFPDKNGSHDDVASFLESKFPKLRDGGGFEVLRAAGGGGGQRSLHLVPPGREGYTVPHLKERFGQAVLYIRPLQKDLNEEPAELEVCYVY